MRGILATNILVVLVCVWVKSRGYGGDRGCGGLVAVTADKSDEANEVDEVDEVDTVDVSEHIGRGERSKDSSRRSNLFRRNGSSSMTLCLPQIPVPQKSEHGTSEGTDMRNSLKSRRWLWCSGSWNRSGV